MLKDMANEIRNANGPNYKESVAGGMVQEIDDVDLKNWREPAYKNPSSDSDGVIDSEIDRSRPHTNKLDSILQTSEEENDEK